MVRIKKTFNFILFLFIIFFFCIQHACAQQSLDMLFSKNSFEKSNSDFKPLTWWHWINGNVTRNGIRQDLIAIHNAGLGGVQLFDVHMYTPKGPVRYGTESWYDDVIFAIRLCDSLGLKFYMMNSPGWSGAGGPWITLEQSMKQLVFSEMDVCGHQPINKSLPQPYAKEGYYRDIAVLAVPSENDDEDYIRKQLCGITSSPSFDSVFNVFDNDPATMTDYSISNGSDEPFIQFSFKVPLQINMLNISLLSPSKELSIGGKVEISSDGVKYFEGGKFKYTDHLGLVGNFTIPINNNETAISYLRLCFDSTKSSFKINEIMFRNLYRIDNWSNSLGMSEFPLLNRSISDKNPTRAISADRVIDLKSFYDADKNLLTWTPPEGKWTILRFGYTTTGAKIHPAVDEGNGYEVDKLDSEAVAFQFNHSIGPIIQRAGPMVGRTFKGILFDSWEAGFQNWTNNFPVMFRELEGYDITKYLPVFAGRTINSKYFSSGILWSFRDAITKLISRNYYGTMKNLAHSYNMLVFSEAEGGPMVPAFGNAYTDIPMNEFWTNGIFQRRPAIKQTVSIANILGRKIIGAESFTSRPEYAKWQSTPYKLKKIGDFAFTLGINRFIFHTYTHQPFEFFPGFTMGRYGTHFERTNTWWKYASSWINYLSRSQLLLQKGRIVSDVGYLVPEDAGYRYNPKVNIPSGYNYDIVYPTYLGQLVCHDGTLVIKAAISHKVLVSYRLLVMGNDVTMTYYSLKKLYDLVKAGATVLGAPPQFLPETTYSVKDKEKFDSLAEKMWGNLNGRTVTQRSYGKGCIYWGKPIEDIFNSLKLLPDIRFHSSNDEDSLYYIHRKTVDADIYFISNQGVNKVSAVAQVRLNKKRPEFWDPATGRIWDAKVFDTTSNRISIPLRLPPSGSIFLVFRKPLPGIWITSLTENKENKAKKSKIFLTTAINIFEDKLLYPRKGVLQVKYSDGKEDNIKVDHSFSTKTVSGPWVVEFSDGRGAPGKINMPKLISWTNDADPAVRYYSGTAIYRNVFTLSEAQYSEKKVCILDLGKLYDIAEVWINGKKVSIIWKKPYSCDITPYLQPGSNKIKIFITNTWANRLIGDAGVPVDYKYETNGSIFTNGRLLAFPDWLYDTSKRRVDKRYTFTTWKHYSSKDPLLKSGLIGPVRLLFYNNIEF